MLGRIRARGSGHNPLPDGAAIVGVGLLINGITTYGFLVIARNSLGEEAYEPLAALWALTFILGPGFFQPLEQEVARATAFRAARGLGSAPVLRRAAQIGGGLLGLVTLGALIAWPLKLDEVLGHRPLLLLALMLALVSFCVSFPLRGLLAGRREFPRYAVYFAVEGGSRMVPAIVFALVAASTGPYGLAVGLAPLIGATIAVAGERPLARPGPEATFAEVSESLGLLLAASLFTNFLLNVGPVAVRLLDHGADGGATGTFLSGMVIARVPLFFFQAVQASLLPQMAALVGEGRYGEFRAALRRLVAAVMALAAVGVLAAAVAGPRIVEVVFGDHLSSLEMALLAGASGGFMVAMSYGSALIAMHHLGRVAIGWAAGVMTFPIVVALIDDLIVRVAAGLLAGSVVAAAAMTLLLHSRLALEESVVEVAPGAPAVDGRSTGQT